MRPTSKIAALACALTLGVPLAPAQEGSKPVRTARGGELAKAARHQFEVFFYTTGLRVFPMDSSGAPLDPSKLVGTATFIHPNSPKPWFSRPLRAEAAAGRVPASLDLVLGLETVPASGATVTFEVSGLDDPAEPAATFTVPFELVKAPAESAAASPSSPTGEAAASPRYVFGAGYQGLGYYRYPGPEAAPASAIVPRVYSPGTSGNYNWATGRSYPIGGMMSRPWLRPTD